VSSRSVAHKKGTFGGPASFCPSVAFGYPLDDGSDVSGRRHSVHMVPHPDAMAGIRRHALLLSTDHLLMTMKEGKWKDRFEASDHDKLEKALQQTLDWLYANQLAAKDEFEAKSKELDGLIEQIMEKVWAADAAGHQPSRNRSRSPRQRR